MTLMHLRFCKMMTIDQVGNDYTCNVISVIKAMMTLRIKWAKNKSYEDIRTMMAEVNRVQVICQIFQVRNNNLLFVLFEMTSHEVKTGRHWPSSLLHFHRPRLYPGGGEGGYSGFQVTGMIKWGQKSQSKKNPWTKN